MIPPKIAPPPLSVIVPNIAAPIIIKTIPSKQPLSELEELLLLEVVFAYVLLLDGELLRVAEGLCTAGLLETDFEEHDEVDTPNLLHKSLNIDRFSLYLPLL